MAFKKLKHITEVCTELYEKQGAGAVYDHANEFIAKQGDSNVHYRNHCEACDANTPSWHDTCLVCGQTTKPKKKKVIMYGDRIDNIKQLRSILSTLDDHDQLCIQTIDEDGDVQDLYPMNVDVIEGITLTDNTIVREVRFCQMPNSEPDTRDKSDLIDAVIKQLMDDYYHGDETCWVELLEHIPYEVLKQSLPEEQWKDFE